MSRMPNTMFVLKEINGKNNIITRFDYMCKDVIQKSMCDQPKAKGKENSLGFVKVIAKGNGREPSTCHLCK
jgi:hypothetical protein